MASAIADRQTWMAALAGSGVLADLPRDAAWRMFADGIPREDAPDA